MNTNPIITNGVSADVGHGQSATPPAPTSGSATNSAQPPDLDPADFRLVIEEDKAAGSFVYKTIDRRTGEVVSQLPREQILRLREAFNYVAGDVIKTRA